VIDLPYKPKEEFMKSDYGFITRFIARYQSFVEKYFLGKTVAWNISMEQWRQSIIKKIETECTFCLVWGCKKYPNCDLPYREMKRGTSRPIAQFYFPHMKFCEQWESRRPAQMDEKEIKMLKARREARRVGIIAIISIPIGVIGAAYDNLPVVMFAVSLQMIFLFHPYSVKLGVKIKNLIWKAAGGIKNIYNNKIRPKMARTSTKKIQ